MCSKCDIVCGRQDLTCILTITVHTIVADSSGLLLEEKYYAQIKLSFAYNKYAQIPIQNGISGAEAAREILDRAGLTDIPVARRSTGISLIILTRPNGRYSCPRKTITTVPWPPSASPPTKPATLSSNKPPTLFSISGCGWCR